MFGDEIIASGFAVRDIGFNESVKNCLKAVGRNSYAFGRPILNDNFSFLSGGLGGKTQGGRVVSVVKYCFHVR